MPEQYQPAAALGRAESESLAEDRVQRGKFDIQQHLA